MKFLIISLLVMLSQSTEAHSKSKLEKEKMRIMEEKFINDVSRETITNV